MRRFLALFLLLSTLTHAAYLGSWAVDDYITITATTHRASSGAAYAATAITLRVYEDDTATEIVEDAAMTAFDSVTGLYASKIQLTAAAGFEAGKCYTALIQATVDSVTAITTHSFQIGAKTTATNMVAAAPTTGQIRTELSTELGRIDAAISTRSTYAGGAVASVTGNVGGNVAGSVASVTAPITVGNPNDCKADLSTLESRLSAARAGYLDKLNVSGTLAHSDAAAMYKATGFSTLTAQQVWEYVTRELTSAGAGGATAQEVWEYATRSLTDKAGFTLHADYDAAKTAAPSVNEIQLGLATVTDVATVNYRVLEVLAALAALNDLDLESVQDAVSGVWFAAERTLTQPVGDATAANQATLLADVALLKNIAEGDTTIDTTVTPWQMVVHRKGNPLIEYLRKNLKDIAGAPITSINTVIAQQEEPE